MNRRSTRLHGAFYKLRTLFSEELVALILVVFIFVTPAGASTRFEQRSLYMNSTEPGVTTSYTVSLNYMTLEPVGSLDMLFCESPIPYDPCVVPENLDVSKAVLSDQAGEMGFTISQKTKNHIVLSRTSTMIAESGSKSSYKFDNIVNPTNESKAFAIRLKSHSSTDASGAQIDFGSVRGQVGSGIVLQTQVPPMLIFCAAEKVEENCTSTNGNYFTDMGTLSDDSTLTAQSQMAVGTNASGGFVIMTMGNPLTAGNEVIDGVATPTESTVGENQFGINLVQNTSVNVGGDPEGIWANAVPTSDYSTPNKFKYVSGDVVAYSPNVSLMKRFTVSYVVNASPQLRAGVYTTTINYVASGRF